MSGTIYSGFQGFSKKQIDNFIRDVASLIPGYIDFSAIDTPASPGVSTLRMWAEDAGGFTQLHFVDTAGLERQLARDNITIVRNNSGSVISKGQWVYITGSQGSFPTVDLAKADSLITMPAAGVVAADIADSSFGQIVTLGGADKLDTSAFMEGDVLYLSPTTAGGATSTPPTGTDILQRLGVVVASSSGNGVIAVLIGGEFDPGLTQTLTNKTLTSPIISGSTVAGLPTSATGMIARVTDADTPVIGSTVVGSGAAPALVWYNGSNWTVIGV